MTKKMNEDNMDEINDGHHFNTTKFMNYLVKNLQVLCHGHVPFNQNLEVIGHIYIKVDCSAKFNCFLNELVSKTDSCQTLFTSNSFQAQSQTENNNRTVINNSKNNVDTHFQERPIVTERRSVEEDISMPVLLKEETAVHLSVSTKENPCVLKENPPKKSNLNLEAAKTCISLPLINTCSNKKKVCNLSPLENKTTSNLSRPSEANISNPTQYGNIWNSLTIVNSSPSIQNDNKDSWNPSFVTKQNTPSSSLSSWSKESMPGSLEKSQCSVKIEPHESYDDNSVVAEFARSEDAILQCKKKFKTETMQTSDCVNDFTYIPTCNTGDIDEQILSDSINFLHNIEALHKAEERALSNSINLLHKIETPHEPEEYTLSDSINLLQNTETHNDTEKKRLSDSVNLKHTTETHDDTEEQTISDSFNLHVKHNIEKHCDTDGSSSALLENINKLDRISKELAIRNIDDGLETTQEVEAGCSSGDNTFIEEDSDSSDVVIVGDFPVLCGAKRKFSDDKENGQLKNKKKSLALIVNDPTLAESNEHNKDNIDSDKDNRDNDGDRNMLTDTGGGKVIQKTDGDDTNIRTTHISGDADTKLKSDRKSQSKTDTIEIGMKLRARNSQGMSYSSDDDLLSEDCSPEFILSDEIEESCSDDNEMSDKIPYMNVSNEMVSKSPPKFQCLELLYPSDNDEDIDEEDVLIDPNIPGVYIKKISKSGTSKFGKIKNNTRVHNQYQNCDICKRKVSNFSQHLLRKHKTVDEVKAIADEKDEKKRKQLLYLLRSKYNHINNVKTLNDQKGEIILERRPCDRFQLDNYGPCPHCLSWVKKTLLWKHSRSCIASSGLNFTSAELRTQSDTLSMRIQPAASVMLIKEVFSKMNNDEVGQVAKSDTLIVLLGNLWILKNIGNPLNRGKYTSQVMRLIARFLINLRAIKHIDGEPSISSYLKPEYFEDIVKATMRTAECNGEDEEDVDKPSVLIKLGLDLKRMLNAKLALAIQNGLPNERKEAEDLLKIFGIMWRTRVTKLARVLLNERQYNKTQSLPDHSDIEKLNNFLKQQLQSLDYDKKDPDNFRLIAETVESKLMIYNRTGEIEDLRLTDYQARKRGVSDFSSSVIENCTKFEKFLLETQDIVEIRGKCGQSVPVIIPSETMEGLQFLTNSTIREQCDISRDNPYVFANKGNTVVKAHTSLSETVNLASLKSPELIISTQERKYMATITQVLDLNESQLNWVTNHTVDVHEIDNETSSDVLDRMQIVKILLLQDSGQVHKYVNKSLDEIQLTDIVSELNQETSDVADSSNNMETDLCDELDETLDVEEPRKKKKAVSSKSIVKWSKEEEDEIHRLFRKYFEIKKRPIPSVCQKAISISKSNNGLIHKRTKATLKKKIFRMIDKLNK